MIDSTAFKIIAKMCFLDNFFYEGDREEVWNELLIILEDCEHKFSRVEKIALKKIIRALISKESEGLVNENESISDKSEQNELISDGLVNENELISDESEQNELISDGLVHENELISDGLVNENELISDGLVNENEECLG